MVTEDLNTIGIIGLINLPVLIVIIIWRSIRFWNINSPTDSDYYKKMCFHIFLLLSPLSDIPMYSGFVVYNSYVIIFYAFHKFSLTFLFAAYSITIYDWSNLLRDIEKDSIHPFMISRKLSSTYFFTHYSLIGINVIFFSITIVNFIYILAIHNLDEYLSSLVYKVGIFVQIAASFLLTCYMLYAGVKLYTRILGVTGAIDANRFAGPNISRALSASHPGVSHEFRSALRSLNLVMATCSLCVFIQMLLLALNYILGYSNKTNVYVGPFFFYWYDI